MKSQTSSGSAGAPISECEEIMVIDTVSRTTLQQQQHSVNIYSTPAEVKRDHQCSATSAVVIDEFERLVGGTYIGQWYQCASCGQLFTGSPTRQQFVDQRTWWVAVIFQCLERVIRSCARITQQFLRPNV